MPKLSVILCTGAGIVAGGLLGSIVEDALKLPWWFSEGVLVVGGIAGYIFGLRKFGA